MIIFGHVRLVLKGGVVFGVACALAGGSMLWETSQTRDKLRESIAEASSSKNYLSDFSTQKVRSISDFEGVWAFDGTENCDGLKPQYFRILDNRIGLPKEGREYFYPVIASRIASSVVHEFLVISFEADRHFFYQIYTIEGTKIQSLHAMYASEVPAATQDILDKATVLDRSVILCERGRE